MFRQDRAYTGAAKRSFHPTDPSKPAKAWARLAAAVVFVSQAMSWWLAAVVVVVLCPAVTTPAPCTSGDADYDHDEVLRKSLRFYEAQRSGFLPNSQRVTWRRDSAIDDAIDPDTNDDVEEIYFNEIVITGLTQDTVEDAEVYKAAAVDRSRARQRGQPFISFCLDSVGVTLNPALAHSSSVLDWMRLLLWLPICDSSLISDTHTHTHTHTVQLSKWKCSVKTTPQHDTTAPHHTIPHHTIPHHTIPPRHTTTRYHHIPQHRMTTTTTQHTIPHNTTPHPTSRYAWRPDMPTAAETHQGPPTLAPSCRG